MTSKAHPLRVFLSAPQVLVGAALILATLAVFFTSMELQFLKYDDDTYVTENPRVQSLEWKNISWIFGRAYFRSYTPLTLFSHALDYAFWKGNPAGHHLTNVLLHCANTLLLYVFGVFLFSQYFRKSSGRDGSEVERPARFPPSVIVGAAATALMFSLNPLKVESVVWISDRKDLLLTFFAILATYGYMKSNLSRESRVRRGWYVFSLSCFLLAILSKSVAIALPLLFVAIDILFPSPRGGEDRRKIISRDKVPFLALSLVFGVVTVLAGSGYKTSEFVTDLSFAERMLLPVYSAGLYVVKTVWPFSLTPVYTPPHWTILVSASLLALVITIVCVEAARKGAGGALLAWSHYVLFLAPTVAGITLGTGMQPWADRYAYLPSAGLFLFAGGAVSVAWCRWHLAKMVGRINVLSAGLVAVLCLWGYQSSRQIPYWSDTETLWRYVLSISPEEARAYSNLGGILATKGDSQGALALYDRALELDPHCGRAYSNMGLAYQALGDTGRALDCFVRAIETRPDLIEAYTSMGNVFLGSGRYPEAIEVYKRALQVDPTSVKALYNMGLAEYKMGNRSASLALFQECVETDPWAMRAYVGLGIVYGESGNQSASLDAFKSAARLGSEDARNVLANRGVSWQ